MSGPELMAVVGFAVTVLGALWGVWWKIDGAIQRAKQDAMQVAVLASTKVDVLADSLAAHKLHVAEVYVSKAGLREQTEQIMAAIKGISDTLAHVTERLDRVIEGRAPGRTVKHSA
ncbi:hypothetical protein ACXIUS_30585 [Bosea thiooxidans]